MIIHTPYSIGLKFGGRATEYSSGGTAKHRATSYTIMLLQIRPLQTAALTLIPINLHIKTSYSSMK